MKKDKILYKTPFSSEVFMECYTHRVPYPKGGECPVCEKRVEMKDNSADEFSFNGLSGVNIHAYQSGYNIGRIRAIKVKGQDVAILPLDDIDYVDPDLLASEFDVVIICRDEYGREKRMAIHGVTARSKEIVADEVNPFTLKCVIWWHDYSISCRCIACQV